MLRKIILGLLYFVAFSNASRVIYMIMHAEKPNYGTLDKGSKWSTLQDIPGERDNGLGKTGYERSKCIVDIFGRNAVSYRQPKAILYQHYSKQKDFIDSGERGLHESRRMYETAALLAKDLGINLDEEKCCGGDPNDMYKYIESLDPSINPILIVHQHQQIYEISKKYAKKYGKVLPYREFEYNSSIVWTLVEGEVVENWNMGCSFDKPTKQDIFVDNLQELITADSNLSQINAGNSTLLQEETPLITTKVVPQYLLTTVTAKVPPNGAATAQPNQPATMSPEATLTQAAEPESTNALEGSKTFQIEFVAPTDAPETPADGPILAPDKPIAALDNPDIAVQEDIGAGEVEGGEAAEAEGETPQTNNNGIVIPEVHAPINVPGGAVTNNNNQNNNNNNNNNNGNNNNIPWMENTFDPLNPFNDNKNNNDDPWGWLFGGNNNNNHNNNNNNNNWDWWNPWSWNNNNNNNNKKKQEKNWFGFTDNNNNNNDADNFFKRLFGLFGF
ncbi:hypothetical protein BCR32DRAFT_271392 [Anaeromyces robustus]|uniref:Phosphoglycerate mutase-like protein n=1 Tax=Anaeromyces robustus TaxID=1754192 RepID=A0A1Y1WRR9_9FUNG|nr:hypothetical protein BCR32DRAFT_271392 [Anaeromyces robustus]|eukprot:ORX76239.1 hypothetical protein BCR32DRAFT_271392 [Anaeromyces robustus]